LTISLSDAIARLQGLLFIVPVVLLSLPCIVSSTRTKLEEKLSKTFSFWNNRSST